MPSQTPQQQLQAIGIEEAGLAVDPPPEVILVEDVATQLDADPALKTVFESLTPEPEAAS